MSEHSEKANVKREKSPFEGGSGDGLFLIRWTGRIGRRLVAGDKTIEAVNEETARSEFRKEYPAASIYKVTEMQVGVDLGSKPDQSGKAKFDTQNRRYE